jgi:hypothetical protein
MYTCITFLTYAYILLSKRECSWNSRLKKLSGFILTQIYFTMYLTCTYKKLNEYRPECIGIINHWWRTSVYNCVSLEIIDNSSRWTKCYFNSLMIYKVRISIITIIIIIIIIIIRTYFSRYYRNDDIYKVRSILHLKYIIEI